MPILVVVPVMSLVFVNNHSFVVIIVYLLRFNILMWPTGNVKCVF